MVLSKGFSSPDFGFDIFVVTFAKEQA